MILPQFFLRLRKVVRIEGTLPADLGEEVLMPPDFFKRYSLMGVDPESVRHVFTPEIVSYFLRQKKLRVDGMGSILIVRRPGRLQNADRIRSFAEEAVALLRLFDRAERRD